MTNARADEDIKGVIWCPEKTFAATERPRRVSVVPDLNSIPPLFSPTRLQFFPLVNLDTGEALHSARLFLLLRPPLSR